MSVHSRQSRTTPASASSTSSSTSSGPASVPRAPAARSSGAEPSAVTDGNRNASIHAPLDVGDAVNPDRSQPGECRDEFEVHILHDPGNRLEMSGCPDEAALFERRPSTGQSADPAWSFVNRQQGTLERPFRIVYPVEDALYIGGAPQADDIQQGGLADCDSLASVASIAARDPGQIQSMISLRGGQASVRLHRYDSSANAWVPCTIGVTNELAQDSDGAGNPRGLVGARFRIGEQAQHSAWSAMVSGTTLSVNEDAYVEVAAWAPILEKAFASYAQTWGQYGGFRPADAKPSTDAAGNARSGYDIISDREGGDFRDLQELMLVTANILTDACGDQRFVYAWHSSTVLGSQFVDRDGAAMNLTQGNLATQAPRIDPTRSTVQLRNPHGGNEPDRRGAGPADGQNDGRFSLSLESWFRVFGLQQHGLVRT